MSFKVVEHLTEVREVVEIQLPPLISNIEGQEFYRCSDYKGKISSLTGIIARGIYIRKINEDTDESEIPSIRIICGIECKDKCINIK